jgi:hypothetical protein
MGLNQCFSASHFMGSQRRRGPLGYHSIPLSFKAHEIALAYANRRNNYSYVATKHFSLSTDFKYISGTMLQAGR